MLKIHMDIFFHLSQISGSRNVGLQARYVFNFYFFPASDLFAKIVWETFIEL